MRRRTRRRPREQVVRSAVSDDREQMMFARINRHIKRSAAYHRYKNSVA
jgi:hypothetical protein